MNITPEHITTLSVNEIFVFGSNILGRHGAGAALTAKRLFGAQQGVGSGPTGRCYAIPTKDQHMQSLPVPLIASLVWDFLRYTYEKPHLNFLVTKIGCGLAGYNPKEIGPLFFVDDAPRKNLWLPKEFWESTPIVG